MKKTYLALDVNCWPRNISLDKFPWARTNWEFLSSAPIPSKAMEDLHCSKENDFLRDHIFFPCSKRRTKN